MPEIPPLTKPLTNVGQLYREMTAGRLPLDAYLAALGTDACATPGCLRPATEVDRAARYCAVCAMRKRSSRALGVG